MLYYMLIAFRHRDMFPSLHRVLILLVSTAQTALPPPDPRM
jgi:hypothetical protein